MNAKANKNPQNIPATVNWLKNIHLMKDHRFTSKYSFSSLQSLSIISF